MADINAIKVPVRTREADALLGIVGMLMVRHCREIEDRPAVRTSQGDELVGLSTMRNVYSGIIDIGARKQIDGISSTCLICG